MLLSFKEWLLTENKIQRVEVNPSLYAEGTNIEDEDKVKSLLRSYDWFTGMINSMARMRQKRADNEYYKDELKKLGVTKIVCDTPESEIKSLRHQEVEL